VLELRYDHWLRRPLHLGDIFQPIWLLPQTRVAYGQSYPATTSGLISLANPLCTISHVELRAVVWIVTKEPIARHRCAILCGNVKDAILPQSAIVDAKDLVDESALRLAELEPSDNGILGELLSQESILQRLQNVSLPLFSLPLFHTTPFTACSVISGPNDLQSLTLSAVIVPSTFLESTFYDLRVGVKI
jgi:hypothetical protein